MGKLTEFLSGEKKGRYPKFGEACLLMVLVCAILIFFNLVIKTNTIVTLVMALTVCAAFAAFWGNSWQTIEDMMLSGLSKGLLALFINVLIGMLIAAWCAGGTVPYIVYLGLKLIEPQFLLAATFIVCFIMSACTGSSWTTAGTVGIAMYGIGVAMGMPPGLIAGAVLAGSYGGDKLSIVSETTNLAAATSETKIMTHLNSMLYVSLPAAIITLVVYVIVGWRYGSAGVVNDSAVTELIHGLEKSFWLNPILLLPLVAMGYLVYKKTPPVLTMLVGIIMGSGLAMFQGHDFKTIAGSLINGYNANSEIDSINSMLSKGGVLEMTTVVFIIIVGMSMGGILKDTKTLETIVFQFQKLINSRFAVITSSMFTVGTMAAVCGDTYASYILTSSAYATAHDRLQIDRKVLSRSCELGVILSCLMIWTSGGQFMSNLFGISPAEYAPYYIWGYLIFIVNMFCAATGWGIFYTHGRRGWGKNKEIPPILDMDPFSEKT